jgi:general stress protein 26
MDLPPEDAMLDPHQPGFAKLAMMIEALEVGMLTTDDEHGHLRSRPMTTQKLEGGVVYFLTGEDSPKVDEVRKDARVNVAYADPNNQVYVSIAGTACATRDPAKIRELWTPGAQRWFPKGPDDPHIALLAVEIAQAEYWDVDKRAMVELLKKGGTAEEIVAATDHKKLS